eukprot:scaffold331115_cov56-Attheya_sp.AAC.2
MPSSTDSSNDTSIIRLPTTLGKSDDDKVTEPFVVPVCIAASDGGKQLKPNQENLEDHPTTTLWMKSSGSCLKSLVTTEMVQQPPTPPRRKRGPSKEPHDHSMERQGGEKRQKTARETVASSKMVAAIEKRLNLWTLEDYEHKPPKYWRKLSVTTLFDESGNLISCDDH